NPPQTAAWGDCKRDYPREAIVSPYAFTTAQAHYEALQEETRRRHANSAANAAAGKPGAGSRKSVAFAGTAAPKIPDDWSGRYRPVSMLENWFSMMLVNQASTIVSLLTPEYQQR